jgi:hypothetical protein
MNQALYAHMTNKRKMKKKKHKMPYTLSTNYSSGLSWAVAYLWLPRQHLKNFVFVHFLLYIMLTSVPSIFVGWASKCIHTNKGNLQLVRKIEITSTKMYVFVMKLKFPSITDKQLYFQLISRIH